MKLRTYLSKHPEVQEFWLQSKNAFILCRRDDFDVQHRHADKQIIRVEEEPEELITLYIR